MERLPCLILEPIQDAAMKLLGMDFSDLSGQYLRAALAVSLLSVWMLVGLFYYLNRYTKRDYFSAWTAAWLFYSLWLTLELRFPDSPPESLAFKLQQCCVAISSVFLLWGSLRFLKMTVQQLPLGLFMLFLVVWTFASQYAISDALDERARKLETQLPVFILLGLSSVFAAASFFRLRKRMPFVGAGMLAAGFFLWGLYLASYPFSQEDRSLYTAGYCVAAVLQLFIAVSMIILVLEEIRFAAEKTMAEIAAVRSEKEAMQVKMISAEEQCRTLYDKVRMTEGLQKAYDELRQTQETVVQQERLRALGQMASGVAHDVNNSLTPVVAYSEMLLVSHPDLPETVREHLDIINRAGEDIARIVARMREFYRRRTDSEPLAEMDVNQTVREVIELTRPRWRDISQRDGISIELRQELDPALPPLLGDASELREALINLVFNAVDALPNGGAITFVTRQLDGKIAVEVRDNGIGMDEPTRQRCLEPFFSTKTLTGGSGLGLAMVYGMMQRQEGAIDVESAPGKGTTMRLTFPLRAMPAPVVSDKKTNSFPRRSLRVLCVDDEELIRQLLEDCLTFFHHQVSTARDGADALKVFRDARQNGQPFEIVITDLGMPKMDGQQLARLLKAEAPETPIVMMTGWGSMIKDDGKIPPEVDALVGKPPQLQELNALLHRLCNAKSEALKN
jgi:signal transduction histidine kinase/ActR/RegA family two-component response regulator